jgi:hypothetical protein
MRESGAGPWLYQGDIMKKQTKKLVLSKETVYALSDLAAVRGNEEIPPPQPTLRRTFSCWGDPCYPYNDTQL